VGFVCQVNWRPGDRYRCQIDDSWWFGTVQEVFIILFSLLKLKVTDFLLIPLSVFLLLFYSVLWTSLTVLKCVIFDIAGKFSAILNDSEVPVP